MILSACGWGWAWTLLRMNSPNMSIRRTGKLLGFVDSLLWTVWHLSKLWSDQVIEVLSDFDRTWQGPPNAAIQRLKLRQPTSMMVRQWERFCISPHETPCSSKPKWQARRFWSTWDQVWGQIDGQWSALLMKDDKNLNVSSSHLVISWPHPSRVPLLEDETHKHHKRWNQTAAW